MNEEIELSQKIHQALGWKNGLQIHPGSDTPLYTLEYLLEALPHKIDGKINHWLCLKPCLDYDNLPNIEWLAWYDGTTYQVFAATPRLAALKLTCALIDANILKPGKE
jgi:hypothetical protein